MTIEELEAEKTRILGLMERVHQVNDPCSKQTPEQRFVNQEVPKMQYIENLRSQLINVEDRIKKLKAEL